MLAAVTQEEHARTFDITSNAVHDTRVAPRTIYALSRVQQQFGASQSTASAFASVVHRDVAPGDPLASLLVRNAFSVAGESNLRFRGGEYELNSYGGATLLQGDAAAVARVQRNNVHYAQRPDRTYAVYDPTRTSLPDTGEHVVCPHGRTPLDLERHDRGPVTGARDERRRATPRGGRDVAQRRRPVP